MVWRGNWNRPQTKRAIRLKANILLLFAYGAILLSVSRWFTVTFTAPDGCLHSLEVLADSTYDAAHLFGVEAKEKRAVGLPKTHLGHGF